MMVGRQVVGLGDDLRLALDRVAFAKSLLITPDQWQEDLLNSSAERVLLNCSRQSGKSTIAAILALHRALFHRESLVLVLAPAERQAKELFSKVAALYRMLGHAIAADSARKLGMELTNGSRIEALPGTEKTIRGFSGVDLLILDEAARVADELYFAVRPMLAVSGGHLLMLSTPYGKRGVFYEEWTSEASEASEASEGSASGAGWERYEVPATEVPRISEAFLEEERRSLPDWVYRQEYFCSFEETEDQVFSYEVVDRAITPEVTPLFVGGDL